MTADTAAIKVLVVDDHAVVREGIRHVLDTDDFEVVGEAGDGVAALDLADALTPDVVILDLSMPRMSGLEAAPRMREAWPAVRILVLSIHDHEEYVLQSVRAGAQGYLRKDSSPAELREAIRVIHEGGSFFSAPAARALAAALQGEATSGSQRDRLSVLTTREREVLIQVAAGLTNKEIASHFGISVRTVESHRETLMKKLGLKGAASLTRFALDAGLLRSSTDA